jgi:protein AATF/BFR2
MSHRKQIENLFNSRDNEDEEIESEDDLNVGTENKKYKDKNFLKNLQTNDKIQNELSKYKGKKVNYEDLNNISDDEIESGEDLDDEGEIADEEEIEDIDGDENIQNIDNIENNENFEDEPNLFEKSKKMMDKEDEEYLKNISAYTPNEIRKGKNVTNQKNLFDFLIGLRISLQKIISSLNALPQGKTFNKFIDNTNSQIIKLTILDFFKLLSYFISFQKELIIKGNLIESLNKVSQIDTEKEFNKLLNKISDISNKINEPEDANNNYIEEIYKIINPLFDNILRISEKIINIWYRKTLVYSFKSNTGNKMLKILNNNFCEHIKSNIESNFASMRKNTMKKSQNEKILGKRHRSTDEYDNEIYNDNDFYSYLLKEFISNKEDVNTNDSANSRYDLTLQYLLNRQKEKKNKNVDTRASKNRKLRFDKHEKIINFMVPMPNHNVNFGRDEIVFSIFGINKRKQNKNDEEEDIGIQLI